MRYRAVIFDLWQTLVPWPAEAAESYYRWMADAYGAPYDRFFEEWTSSFRQRATGPIEDNLRSVATALAVEPDFGRVLEWRLEWTRSSLVPRPDAVRTLETLRARGHSLGLITVCSQEVAAVWDETPFAGLFDATVFSCEVGLSKPDPEIYVLACEQLGVEPRECLFVGDGANDELPGAERVGMAALQLRALGESLTPDGEAWQGASIEQLSEVVELTE
ncbi:MAG TPA: HAD family hydrolase [Gaiellaceae bacterium]|nr:HAD family hydrolase [Gaiellaceae bacterium]